MGSRIDSSSAYRILSTPSSSSPFRLVSLLRCLNLSTIPLLSRTSLPKISQRLPHFSSRGYLVHRQISFLTLFFSYIVLQGLAGTAGGFLQIVSLIVYYVKLVLLGSTPRSVWRIKYGLNKVAWGTLFPTTTLLVVISMSISHSRGTLC